MEQFMLLFRSPMMSAQEMANLSQEEMQASMNRWYAWIDEVAKTGQMLSCEQLGHEGKVLKTPSAVVTDGMYVEAQDVLGGYMIIKAENLAAAVEIAKKCPGLEEGGNVEVRNFVIHPSN